MTMVLLKNIGMLVSGRLEDPVLNADAVLIISSVTKQALQELGDHLWRVLSRIEDLPSDSEALL